MVLSNAYKSTLNKLTSIHNHTHTQTTRLRTHKYAVTFTQTHVKQHEDIQMFTSHIVYHATAVDIVGARTQTHTSVHTHASLAQILSYSHAGAHLCM